MGLANQEACMTHMLFKGLRPQQALEEHFLREIGSGWTQHTPLRGGVLCHSRSHETETLHIVRISIIAICQG